MNGHPGINPTEATQHLKDILNVGKSDPNAGRLNSVFNGSSNTSSDMQDPNQFNGDNMLETPFKATVQKQHIVLLGNDDQVSYKIYGEDVTILPSLPHHNSSSSSKIYINNILQYGWEHKYYVGRIVASHLSGTYLAYAIRGPSSTLGIVRVRNHATGERGLIKGLKGEVKEISFAHTTSRILLASIDEYGNLLIHEVLEEDGKIVCKLILHIPQPNDTKSNGEHRIIWCPFIPDDLGSLEDIAENPPDDASTLLVVTHDEKAEMMNIDTIVKEYGTGEITSDRIKHGIQRICEHKLPITSASFSPDGTALATASSDGEVKFFQVYMQERDVTPRCLHQWIPHDGKELSSLFFLDNHKNPSPDVQFWKFAVTGANNNQEIKLWSCESWTCLQTIRFAVHSGDCAKPCLKVDLDLSASYLVLSDINKNVLYILQIHQEPSTSQAHIYSISEFTLSLPVLSFTFGDVSHCKMKPSVFAGDSEGPENEERDIEGEDEANNEETYTEGVMVNLFWITTKTLQKSRIIYQPLMSLPTPGSESITSLSQESFVFRDRLSDLSIDAQELPKPSSDADISLDTSVNNVLVPCSPSALKTPRSPMATLSHSANYKGCGEILLTPDDFTSPSHAAASSAVTSLISLPSVEEASHTSPKQDKEQQNLSNTECGNVGSGEEPVISHRKSSQHSSTSSPSREVAEIMAPAKILGDEQDNESGENETGREESPVVNNLGNISHSSSDKLKGQKDYNSWPQAPDPTKEYRVVGKSDGEQQRNRNVRQSQQAASLVNPDDTSHIKENKFQLVNIEHMLDSVLHSLNPMKDMLNCQKQEIQDIHQQLHELKKQQKFVQTHFPSMEQLGTLLCDKIDHTLSQDILPAYNKFESALAKRDDLDKQWLDRQCTTLTQNVTTNVGNRIEKSVKSEIKTCVLPHISKSLETAKDQLQIEMAHKLTATDNIVRENINKLAKNKAFTDNLGQSLASSLHPQIQIVCREVFQTTIVPSFDKACQNLFHQLNEAFHRGTVEYLQQIERQCTAFQAGTERTSNQFQEQITKLNITIEKILGSLPSRICEQIKNILTKKNVSFPFSPRQEDVFLDKVKLLIQEEIQSSLKDRSAGLTSLRSHTVTPIPPPVDPQVQQQFILQMIKHEQYNAAFQQALSAADLNLVVFVCEGVSPSQIFSQNPCPLQQPVLLSLIQQLSGDFSSHTQLKLRYIEGAITNLDIANPVTRNHVGGVLGGLRQKLSLFMQNNSNHSLLCNMKMILMATQPFVVGARSSESSFLQDVNQK